jgi:GT2 family glycosyltransferase
MLKQINFSIVVPTHGRPDQFFRLAESIARIIKIYQGEIEVIVVDSSQPNDASAIQHCCDKYRFVYLQDQNHVCKKRNRGIDNASKPYIFFTDSDCRLESDVFSQHTQTYQANNPEIVGVLGLTEITGNQFAIWKHLQYDPSFTAAFNFARWLEYAPWGTCTNLSIKKEALQEVGGFDNQWPLVVYGEDVDLGLRIAQTGKQIACNPEAVVTHDSSNFHSFWRVVQKKWKTGCADFYLGKKHPNMLVYEFPDWISIFILILPVMLIQCVRTQSFLPLLLLGGVFVFGILSQALIGAIQQDTPSAWVGVFVSTILENIFVAGRIQEAIKHRTFNRIWKKFVYVQPQLLAERNRRVAQAWAIVLCMMLLLFF